MFLDSEPVFHSLGAEGSLILLKYFLAVQIMYCFDTLDVTLGELWLNKA